VDLHDGVSELSSRVTSLGAEERPVDPRQHWALSGSAQHRDLMAEHDDLDVRGGVGARKQRQPARYEDLVRESSGHSDRSC